MEAAAEHARTGNLQYFEQLDTAELQKLASKKDEDHRSLLHSVASGGNVELVDQLLKFSPNEFINAQDDEGWTPLQSAVSSSHVDVCRLLISAGADVNTKNSGGRTAMHYAASKGNVELLQILFQHGGKVNVQDLTGSTPLHRAASSGKLEAVRFLVQQAKARVDESDKEGATPLFVALTCENASIAVLLASEGADLQAATKEGQTPLDIAGKVKSALIEASEGVVEV